MRRTSHGTGHFSPDELAACGEGCSQGGEGSPWIWQKLFGAAGRHASSVHAIPSSAHTDESSVVRQPPNPSHASEMRSSRPWGPCPPQAGVVEPGRTPGTSPVTHVPG